MSINSGQSVLSLLRSRLSDDTAVKEAFAFRVTDAAREAYVQIYGSRFETQVINGVNAENLVLELGSNEYGTVQKLITYLNSKRGYLAQPSAFIDQDFPSAELELTVGETDLVEEAVIFYHRRFSNSELIDVLNTSARAHNLNYTYETIPEAELQLVLDLAHAHALRRLASETVKRVGMDIDVATLMNLAASYEESYQEVMARQRRAIPVPSINDSLIGEGDIIAGKITRPSLRYGRQGNRANTNPPERPVLVEPKDLEIGDDYILLKWVKTADPYIIRASLWRDTTPQVRQVNEDMKALYTSKLVFRGAHNYVAPYYYNYCSSEDGDGVYSSFLDGKDPESKDFYPLEPLTTYFYRLYYMNTNRTLSDSGVISCKTKPLRAKLATVTPLAPTHGPVSGGTAITITGTNFHSGMKLMLGDKPVTSLTVVTSVLATAVSPQVYNPAYKGRDIDVVLQSNTGLKDILSAGWRYDA